jgi:hypothetical protein
MTTTRKGKTVYEVAYRDDSRPYAGAAGDGTFIARFLKRKAADEFAASHWYYSGPATVSVCEDGPKRLTDRLSFMG